MTGQSMFPARATIAVVFLAVTALAAPPKRKARSMLADTPPARVAVASAPEAALPPPPAAKVEPPSEPIFIDRDHSIALKVAHHFERAVAKERITQLLDYWGRRFGVKSIWQGDRVFMTGSVYGVDISALFDITDYAVVGMANDPGWFWRGRAQSYVEKKLKKYLHPSYAEP